MKKLTALICLFFIAFLPIGLSAVDMENASAEMYLSKENILVGQPDTLTIALKARERKVVLPSFEDTLTKSVEVLGMSTWDTAFAADGDSYFKQLYVTSFDTGFFVVPPIVFLVGFDSILTRPLLLQVSGEKVDLSKNILDIAEIEEFPITLMEIVKYIGVIILVFILFFIGYKYFKSMYLKYKLNKESSKEIIPEVPFIELFWADYAILEKALAEEKSWGEVAEKRYTSKLSNLLRTYIEDRYGIAAMENTSAQILAQARARINDVKLEEEVRSILVFADQVKFAKGRVVKSDLDLYLLNLQKFVKKTFVEVSKSIEMNPEEVGSEEIKRESFKNKEF